MYDIDGFAVGRTFYWKHYAIMMRIRILGCYSSAGMLSLLRQAGL